jgi:hypothetical protein
MSKKLGNVTESVFEFIYNRNQEGVKLHEFDIISRFKNVIGYTETLNVLERLSKKKHLLRSSSTKTSSRGRKTYYYRVDPDNLYFIERSGGRKVDPEKMKKLEAMRDQPYVPAEAVSDTTVLDQHIALAKTSRKPSSEEPNKIHESWNQLVLGPVAETVVRTPTMTNGVDVVGGPAKLDGVILESREIAEAKGAVMLVLDLGESRTEMVDAQTAHRLYRGLHAIFGNRSN